MNLKIKYTNIEMTEAIENYLREKISKLSKFLDLESENNRIEAELEKTNDPGNLYRTELNLHFGGEFQRVEVKNSDLYASIDEAIDELERSVRKVKGKKETLFKKGNRKIKEMMRKIRG